MGQLRIIAGQLRGRRIAVPRSDRVRPTADRVREALFSILAERVTGARVLDAYSGSGALGFEALSRGAERVVFIEAERQVAAVLRGNAKRLGVEPLCTLMIGRAHEVVGHGPAAGPFDLILADPPYSAGQGALFLPAAARCLDPGGLLVMERDTRIEPPEGPLSGIAQFRTARYGSTCLDFYRPVAEAPDRH